MDNFTNTSIFPISQYYSLDGFYHEWFGIGEFVYTCKITGNQVGNFSIKLKNFKSKIICIK